MKVVIGSDHTGFALEENLVVLLREMGHEVVDVRTASSEPVDYPDFVKAVGEAVLVGKAERCGSGVAASVAANKLPGTRNGLCHDSYSAQQAVEQDDMNVLVMGARVIGEALARELLPTFLGVQFTGEERHRRRIEKIVALERKSVRKKRLLIEKVFPDPRYDTPVRLG